MRNYVVLTKKTKSGLSILQKYHIECLFVIDFPISNAMHQNIKSGHLWTVGNRLFKFSSDMFLCFLNFLQ